jgi:uncharacterized protein YbjT (DUF2867 family)
MKVGVLGSGDVAKALAEGFAKHGHHVVMGTRDPSKLKDWDGPTPLHRPWWRHGGDTAAPYPKSQCLNFL